VLILCDNSEDGDALFYCPQKNKNETCTASMIVDVMSWRAHVVDDNNITHPNNECLPLDKIASTDVVMGQRARLINLPTKDEDMPPPPIHANNIIIVKRSELPNGDAKY
jgi:hypothetical protein